jgi:hypothetical protein
MHVHHALEFCMRRVLKVRMVHSRGHTHVSGASSVHQYSSMMESDHGSICTTRAINNSLQTMKVIARTCRGIQGTTRVVLSTD